MFKYSLLLFITAAATCTSSASLGQDLTATAHGWDPSEFQLSMDGPCSHELATASDFLVLRESGKSKKEALAAFMAVTHDSTPMVQSILDDVYENPGVLHFPYFVYRNITCMRRHAGKSVPQNLASVAPQMMACQVKFGVKASDHLISCIQHVVAGEAS